MYRTPRTALQLDIMSLTFEGLDGNECEDFVASVRHFAFFEGKGSDDHWKLNFATACLRGKALRWHAELDSTLQKDWDRFVKALLTRYPPITTIEPVPAAAPINRARRALVQPVGPGPRNGRIRLAGVGFYGTDYVGGLSDEYRPILFRGNRMRYMKTTISSAGGSKIRFMAAFQHHGIYLDGAEQWLGVSWDDREHVGLLTSADAPDLVPAPTPFPQPPAQRVTRPVASEIWHVGSDGTLSATQDSNDPDARLSTVAVHLTSGTIHLVKDFQSFAQSDPKMYYEARLVFEPL